PPCPCRSGSSCGDPRPSPGPAACEVASSQRSRCVIDGDVVVGRGRGKVAGGRRGRVGGDVAAGAVTVTASAEELHGVGDDLDRLPLVPLPPLPPRPLQGSR